MNHIIEKPGGYIHSQTWERCKELDRKFMGHTELISPDDLDDIWFTKACCKYCKHNFGDDFGRDRKCKLNAQKQVCKSDTDGCEKFERYDALIETAKKIQKNTLREYRLFKAGQRDYEFALFPLDKDELKEMGVSDGIKERLTKVNELLKDEV